MVTLPLGDISITVEGRNIVANLRSTVGEEMKADLATLIGMGVGQLEIVVRQRAPSPQEVQSAANAARSTAYGRLEPKMKKKAVNSDAPETQPEPEEPTTAQTVEEFGSWG